MSNSPQTPAVSSPALSAASPASDGGLDHLAHLHRMSRTAGLGSSEYAAVNVAAVVAVLIGAASALALVTPFFLFLPIVGTVLALVAIKQIRGSNGTQTGLIWAVLALVLSFGLTAFTGAKAVAAAVREKSDVRELDQLTVDFGRDLAEKRFADAYKRTDARFQEQIPVARLESLFTELDHAPTIGPLKNISTPKLFNIEIDPETGLRMASSKASIETEKRAGPTAVVTDFTYRHDGTAWHIYAIPQLFPPAKPGSGGSGGAGGSGAGGAPAGPAGPPA